MVPLIRIDIRIAGNIEPDAADAVLPETNDKYVGPRRNRCRKDSPADD